MSDVRFPLVRLVDSADPDAAVLYDCQDRSLPDVVTFALADGFSIGAPQLQGDPDALGVVWDPRVVRFTQVVQGLKRPALAVQSRLARVLLRQRVWVMFQLDRDTAPVWWHAYRSQPGDIDFDQVYVDRNEVVVPAGTLGAVPRSDSWRIDVTLDAEAFGSTPRVTIPMVSVGNDPDFEGTHPALGFVLPALSGDAPCGLRVFLEPGISSSRTRFLIACISSDRPAPILRSPIGTGDGFTAENGTAAGTARAGSVGGTARVVSFATDRTLKRRLVADLPTGGGSSGRYRMLLRCTAGTPGGGGTPTTLTFALGDASPSALDSPTGPAIAETFNNTLPSAGPAVFEYVEVGQISVGGNRPPGVPAATTTRVGLYIAADRADATAVIDDIVLIPISGPGIDSVTSMTVDCGLSPAGPTRALAVDTNDEAAWFDTTTTPDDNMLVVSGGFPVADPASAYNVVLALPLKYTGGAGPTDLAATATVDVSYRPQVLWLGDGRPSPLGDIDPGIG